MSIVHDDFGSVMGVAIAWILWVPMILFGIISMLTVVLLIVILYVPSLGHSVRLSPYFEWYMALSDAMDTKRYK